MIRYTYILYCLCYETYVNIFSFGLKKLIYKLFFTADNFDTKKTQLYIFVIMKASLFNSVKVATKKTASKLPLLINAFIY